MFFEQDPFTEPEILITAGGTRELIDDVRYIGNFSSGRLGRALAEEYATLGRSTLLLTPNSCLDRFGKPQGVETIDFTSAENLQRRMLGVRSAKLVLHAAAVSDYTPQRIGGKISSDQEQLVLHLQRTPKILPQLRDHFGPETKVVGFKLLSGVPEEDLIAAAVRQIKTAKTDLCIANDLQEIRDGKRVLHVVQPDGSYQTIRGYTGKLAQKIARDLLPVGEVRELMEYEW